MAQNSIRCKAYLWTFHRRNYDLFVVHQESNDRPSRKGKLFLVMFVSLVGYPSPLGQGCLTWEAMIDKMSSATS